VASASREENATPAASAPIEVQYANAKVLVVGDTSAGKTALTHRLATGHWKPSESSTVGSWATQWSLTPLGATPNVEREVWLWDFGGQADQRLIHQLYMDHSSLVLLLFNPDQEEVLPGLRDWITAIGRAKAPDSAIVLVAGRTDAGFRASRSKIQSFARDNGLQYFETSALSGVGCGELHAAIVGGIAWGRIPITTTKRLFKLIKDEIIKLRDEGQVLHTFKELRELIRYRLPPTVQISDAALRTVIGHLDAPGAVRELNYGTYVLLAPEWINVYAQAVIRTIRSDVGELGRIPLRSIMEGALNYHIVSVDGSRSEVKRLQAADERVVLAEMEQQLRERGLCLQQGEYLVFPSHCGRDRPALTDHPHVVVSYSAEGYLDDLYATLVAKLADSHAFNLKDTWKDAADFETLEGGHRMGVKLTRANASSGEFSAYFGVGVTSEEQVIFANYIHGHLQRNGKSVRRLRHYVCPKCLTPKGNAAVLMEKLYASKKSADTECDKCGHRFPLWDSLEKKFASKVVRDRVEGLQVQDLVRLDARRKGKLLALEVAARITSADQKCFEIPGTEDEGIDMELEFTDGDGNGTGQRIYLQLKAGSSHLRRDREGKEYFLVKKQRWIKYWISQKCPVFLVVGKLEDSTARDKDEGAARFSDIRWMEISGYLKTESDNGRRAVKRIPFSGERLDAQSIQKWRQELVDA